jgi:hypothetical protein
MPDDDDRSVGAEFMNLVRERPDEAPYLWALLAGRPSPVEARAAYAAWLVARGDPRGEALELALALSRAPDETRRARLRAVLPDVTPAWWRLVRPPQVLLNCGAARGRPPPLRFAFRCPMGWEQLAATDRDDVRRCDDCRELVYRCDSTVVAEWHARLGHCVSVPAGLADEHADRSNSVTGRVEPPVRRWARHLFGDPPDEG